MKNKKTIWEKDDLKSYRERVKVINMADVVAVFDFLSEGSINREKAEEYLDKLVQDNVDFMLAKQKDEFKKMIKRTKIKKGKHSSHSLGCIRCYDYIGTISEDEINQICYCNYNQAIDDILKKLKEL